MMKMRKSFFLFLAIFMLFIPGILHAQNYDPSPADSITQLIKYPFYGTDDPNDKRIPIILIHGIHGTYDFDDDNILSEYEAVEQLSGWDNFLNEYNNSTELQNKYKIYRFLYLSDIHSVWEIARSLRNKLDDAIDCENSNSCSYGTKIRDVPFVVVAHSMGGLVARSYMNEHDTNTGSNTYQGKRAGERVLKLITLATPHHGAPGVNHDSRDQLAYNADWSRDFLYQSFWGLGNDWSTLISGSSFFYWQTQWSDHVQYNEPNRKDLLWDNFDGIMESTNDDVTIQTCDDAKTCLKALNNKTTYDNRTIVYYGYLDPSTYEYNGETYLSIVDRIYVYSAGGGPSTVLLPYGLSTDNHKKLLAGSIAMNYGFYKDSRPYENNDGMVPKESAAFDGHNTVAKQVECPNHDHLDMKDGKTTTCNNGLTLLNSVKTDLLTIWNETHGTLTGTIKDQNTGSAISGASVQIYGPNSSILRDTKTSDSNGSFSFTDLELGDYYLKITKSGYNAKFTDFYAVSAGTSNSTGAINLTPSVSAPVTRTLTIASSNPNSGVYITTSPSDVTTPFSRTYDDGTEVTLIAPTTANGNNFSGWSGCDSTSGTSGTVCTLMMNANRTVSATFNFPLVEATKIVFSSDRDGNLEIYLMNTDGTNQIRLTNNTANDYEPSWSSDGTKIAFVSDRDGNAEIYVMNADGTNQTRLTNNSTADSQLAWSPDGTKIVFASERDTTNTGELYTMNADGTNQQRLTNNSTYDAEPTWSPDGTKIAFASYQYGTYEIFTMNSDGTNQYRLTNSSVNERGPAWSPDGTKIVFKADDGSWNGTTDEIYIINADGTNRQRLTNNSAEDNVPTWSSDGTKIVFDSKRDGNYEIYIMNSDGSNQTRLTNNSEVDRHPSWSTITEVSSYALTITKSGMGSGSVTATGITCGSDCSEIYTSGTVVALSTTPDTGSTVAGWSGDSDCSDGQVTMNATKTCTANFAQENQTGSIRVSIVPQEAADTGAQWKLSTESSWHNSGEIKYSVPFGTYTVEFKYTTGWTTSPDKEVAISVTNPDIWIDSDNYVQTYVPAPTNLQTVANADNTITLTWNDNSSNEEAFTLEWRIGMNGSFGQRVVLAPNTTSWVDDGYIGLPYYGGLKPGTTYCYRVKSFASALGYSLYSDESCATIPGQLLITYYCDNDSDGYFDSINSGSCFGSDCQPAGCQIASGNDCNDTDVTVNPGMTEGPVGNATCSDLKDNDCNGLKDLLDAACRQTTGKINLPKTGQNSCYDSSGSAISCSGAGHDGEIQTGAVWPDPRFIITYCDVNGPCADQGTDCDGNSSTDVITDKLTGLMWPRNGNLANGNMEWYQALTYVEDYNFGICNYYDWRLPNINELESLINAGLADSGAWLNNEGFVGVQSTYYWSSTHKADEGSIWIIPFNSGAVSYASPIERWYVLPARLGQMDMPDSNYHSNVWKTGYTACYDSLGNSVNCAGTGQDGEYKAGVTWPNPRFSDNGEGVVTDNLTGLKWLKDAGTPAIESCTGGVKTWQEAFDYVACLNSINYLQRNDWRVPNRKELRSLVDYSQANPPISSGNLFINVHSESNKIYWSSTTSLYNTNSAWGVYMRDGRQQDYSKTDYSVYTFYVWPVAGRQGPYQLVLTKLGTGNGDVTTDSGTITWSGNAGDVIYNSGTLVTLTATADSSSTFTGWSGGGCSGTGPCILTMNADTAITATFDDSAPPIGNISLNSGSTYTNITSGTLTLSASDPTGVSQMCISNTTTCSTWEAYATSKSWTLPSGDGTKNVYVWFKDSAGNVNSTPYSGSIILDPTAPSNGTLSLTSGDGQVLLNWSGFSDALSGINNYKVVYSTGDTPSSCSTGTQIYYDSGTTYTHTGLANGVTYNYRVCAIDNAGNSSSGATASAIPVVLIPNISPSAASLNFGDINVNTTSSAQTVTFTNTGTADLNVTGGALSGTDAAMFAIIGGTCPIPPFTSAPSESCNLSFTFTPTSAGAKTATFTINSNDPDTAQLDVPLSGTGIAISQYTLTVEKTGTGSGTVTATGINCGSDCTEIYTSGTVVTLSPAPDTGSTFIGWTGCDSVSGNTCDITMNTDKAVTASFIPSALYVVWQDDTLTPGNMDIFMKKSTDNGVTWTWQQISNNAGNSQLPMIAVDNTNAVYVVWQDNTLGNNDIFMKKSTDNGVTWTWQQISNNAGNSQLPMIAVDNTNAVYVVWQDDTLGNNDIFMKKSTDNGVTWTWQQISNNAGNSQLPMIAVDNTNAVYVVWQDDTLTPGNSDIFMKKSTDNGVTWTWQQISNNAGNSQLPTITVDNTNAVYVVWQDNTLGNNDIFMKKSTDNGVTWVWQQISNNAGNSLSPKIAVDNTNAVYVVWQDDTLTPGNMDIFMKKSTDNGATWTWQQISNNAGNSQLPMITVDNTNAVYVVWQDDTLTPGNMDIFMKKSTDNGATWTWQQISNNAGNSIMPAMPR